jgi:hypothetical protein
LHQRHIVRERERKREREKERKREREKERKREREREQTCCRTFFSNCLSFAQVEFYLLTGDLILTKKSLINESRRIINLD